MVETNLTWDEAIKSLTILDGSISLPEKLETKMGQLLSNPGISDAAVPIVECVKRLGKTKHSKSTKFCKNCRKKCHLASVCWQNKT